MHAIRERETSESTIAKRAQRATSCSYQLELACSHGSAPQQRAARAETEGYSWCVLPVGACVWVYFGFGGALGPVRGSSSRTVLLGRGLYYRFFSPRATQVTTACDPQTNPPARRRGPRTRRATRVGCSLLGDTPLACKSLRPGHARVPSVLSALAAAHTRVQAGVSRPRCAAARTVPRRLQGQNLTPPLRCGKRLPLNAGQLSCRPAPAARAA